MEALPGLNPLPGQEHLFLRDRRWYRANDDLDHDRDGIACEITQGRLRSVVTGPGK